jgi:large subunit ribosomal protein L10
VKREEKMAVVANTAERLSRAQAVILTDFTGLKVEQMTELRQLLREKGLEYVVVKNTLLKRAAEGTSVAGLLADLAGPNGLALSYGEPVDLAKILVEFAKTNPKLEVRKGLLGQQVISAEQVTNLAKLPGREVLLSQLLGVMNGVPRGLVTVLAGVVRGLLNVLKAVEEQKAAQGA